MKYFVIEKDGEDILFTRASSVKKYLKEHPEIKEVYRYWWYRDELVEMDIIDRDKFLTKTAKELQAGETAQWAYARGRF